MKLWYLEPLESSVRSGESRRDPWDPWYDKAFGFVVRAKNEVEARQFAAADAGDEAPSKWFKSDDDFNPWLDSNYSSCTELTNEGVSDVVLRDFMSS